MKRNVRVMAFILSVLSAGLTFGQSLKSAAEPDYPPFSIVKPDGSADGFAVDLLKATAEAMGQEVSFKTAPWDQIKTELADGKLDVLPLVGRTPEREELYDFTVPYLTLHGALFVRDDETGIQRLTDLPGKKIAVMKGDNAEEYVLRAKLSDQIISTTTFEEAFQLLSAGEADAVIAQKLMGVSLLKQLGIQNIQIVGRPNQEFKQNFCFAVQKGNAGLLAILNEGLAIVNAKGIQRQLQQKWMGPVEYEVEKDRVLIYAGDQTYPPFEFLDKKGRPAGFNIDLARALSKEIGVNLSVQLLPWSEVRRKAAGGELDITSMLYSEGRSRDVDYSTPLLASAQAVFGRDDSPTYRTLDDLKAYRISVQDGDLAHDFALEHGLGENLTVAKGPQEALKLLAEGKVDFSLGALLQGQYWIKENGWKTLRAVEPQLYVTDYCFAVPNGRTDLLKLLNAGLLQLKTSGEYRRIYNEWLGPLDPTENWKEFRRQLLIGAGSLLLLATLAAIWIFALQHQVKKRTADLRKSDERFNLATEAGSIGVWDRDIVNDRLVWDERMYQIYGIRKENFGGAYEVWRKSLHPDDLDRAVAEVAAAEQGDKPFDTEFRIIRPDGEIRHIRASAKVIFDKKGNPRRMIGTNQDITEKKQAEKTLQESEERLRRIVENSTNMFYSHTPDQVLTYVSPQVKNILGYEAEEAAAHWYGLAANTPGNQRGFELTDEAINTGEAQPPYELQLIHKDGHPVWVEVREAPVVENGKTIAIVGSLTDITSRKEAEKALQEQNDELLRFNKAFVGRELKMIELKKEVNALSRELGKAEPYSADAE